MWNPLSSKGFLQVGGVVLIVVGILSYLPFTNSPSGIFGPAWWFDGGEGVAHIFLGVVAIAAAYVLPASLHKPLVVVVGIVALLFGVAGGTVLMSANPGANFYGLANLESPLDNILHLFVAAWALYASLMSKATPESKMM